MFKVMGFNLNAQIPGHPSSTEGGSIRLAAEFSATSVNCRMCHRCLFTEGILRRPSCDTPHIFNSSPSAG
jgi:hypothetical protein